MHAKHQTKINGHAKKILQPKPEQPQKLCNCRVKGDCPLNGLCLTANISYQATIKCSDSKHKQKRYKEIVETTFKKRYANHKKLFNWIVSKNDTTWSIEYRTLKQKQPAPRLTWKVKGQYKNYNPTLKRCNLCLNEKLAIIDNPDKNLLNKRSKGISQCRHRKKFMLVSLTSRKTRNDIIKYVIPFYCIVPLQYSAVISRLRIVAWVTWNSEYLQS